MGGYERLGVKKGNKEKGVQLGGGGGEGKKHFTWRKGEKHYLWINRGLKLVYSLHTSKHFW